MAGKRYYTCNYHYFDTIDTDEKAYWLGFIMADGTVCHYERVRHLKTQDSLQIRDYLQLSLTQSDKGHLEKFKKAIDSTHPILEYNVIGGFKKGAKYCRIVIEDKHLCESLNKYGIVPRKSLITKFPIGLIEENYYLPFIRGFFDGNGCLSYHCDEHGSISFEGNIVGTFEILTIIADILNIKTKMTQRFPERNKNNYTLRFSGNQNCFRIMSMIYNNASVYLDRKYDKYLKLIDYNNGRS